MIVLASFGHWDFASFPIGVKVPFLFAQKPQKAYMEKPLNQVPLGATNCTERSSYSDYVYVKLATLIFGFKNDIL